MDRRVKTCIDHHERYHRSCSRLTVCAGDVDYVLICSCEGAEEFGSVKDLEIEFGRSLHFFVVRKDSSRLYKIIRLKVIDIGSDLAVVDLYSLLF